jgi:hypothetical protein
MIRAATGVLAAMLLAGSCLGAQLRLETRLEPSGPVVVGQNVELHVDVLTDTWFTSAPQLPVLEIDNATVASPSGEARHLNLSREGTPFFGLAFTYRITPTATGDLLIAPLTVSATPGQASGPMSAQTEPLRLKVEQPEGVPAGALVLVARALEVTQDISQSRDTLTIGDTVRRQVTQTADGAQLMLMPMPPLAEIDGLKRYVAPPQLNNLDDGRGNVTQGVRVDSVSYQVIRAGDFQLPPISMQWWDSGTRQLRTADLAGFNFSASSATLKTPFSVTEDLQRLGRQGRISLSRHGLVLSLWLIGIGALLYLGWPWLQREWQIHRQRRAARHAQWLASPRYALNQIAGQIHASPPTLDALYLWIRRQYGATGLRVVRDSVPPDFTARLYGRDPQPAQAFKALEQSPALLHPHTTARQPGSRYGLRPLNPRTPRTTEQERSL